MSKFKVGDRVRVISEISNPGGADVGYEGTVTAIDGRAFGYSWRVVLDNGEVFCDRPDDYLTKVSASLDNLSVDDVVVNDEGEEYTVAAVIGRVVILEDENGHAMYDGEPGQSIFTVKDLKDNDWTVKTAEEDLTEVTLDQVAKAMKVDVSKLRIKE